VGVSRGLSLCDNDDHFVIPCLSGHRGQLQLWLETRKLATFRLLQAKRSIGSSREMPTEACSVSPCFTSCVKISTLRATRHVGRER
jgi:hypothetical protein